MIKSLDRKSVEDLLGGVLGTTASAPPPTEPHPLAHERVSHKLTDLGPALLCSCGILPAIKMLLLCAPHPPFSLHTYMQSKFEKGVLLASGLFFFSYNCTCSYSGFYLFCSSVNKTETTTQVIPPSANTSSQQPDLRPGTVKMGFPVLSSGERVTRRQHGG